MLMIWFLALLSTFIISAISLIGVFGLVMEKSQLHKIIIYLISLSAGTLLGGAFLHLLPEASLVVAPSQIFLVTLLSFILFFLIEKILHWQHSHHNNHEIQPFGYVNLIGNSLHNFLDGTVVAGAYMFNIHLGLITTLLVILHEIPKEIGDFGVLVKAGFTPVKALVLNFISGLIALTGTVVALLAIAKFTTLSGYLLIIAAGGFIYIGAADLLPEINHESNHHKSLQAFVFFLIGVAVMFLFKE